jgi:CheY-like chemotaxis protein
MDENGAAPGWEAKGSLRGLRLVLVEDEPDQRQLLRRVFVDQGAEVRVAEDASGGLELVRSVRPQVLVSDLGLPGVDGYEFLRRVRELPPGEGGRVPAVALTAFARTVDRQRALRAGYQAHVAKPAEPSELVAIIANLASVADPR